MFGCFPFEEEGVGDDEDLENDVEEREEGEAEDHGDVEQVVIQ